MSAAPERYHALDALRGFAMFLGVLLHAAIPYTRTPVPFWPVQDSRRSNVFDFLLLFIHDFRMQLFFLLAGFFGCLLYTRYGAVGTGLHRFKRVALPLLLALVTIQPALQAVAVYAVVDAVQKNPHAANTPKDLREVVAVEKGPTGAVVHHFATGTFLRFMIPVHLWFLWYLLICFAAMLALALLADRLRDRGIGRAWDAAFHWLFRSKLRWLVLTAVTWPLLLLMASPIGPDTPLGWMPPVQLVAYYFLFFTIGWTLYRHRELLHRFASGWAMSLAAAIVLVFPVALGGLYFALSPDNDGIANKRPFEWLAHAAMALFTWLMIGGLLGLFLHALSRERASIRWLADSSYWCYLASLPPVLVFQYLLVDWDAIATVKFLVVTVATMAVLLASYRISVRYTWIGRLLNGPRTKPVRQIADARKLDLVSTG